MNLFILGCLSFFIFTVMIMIAVQLIRIEKSINELNDFTEARVKKLYGKK